jgi:DNA helicase-2/ATP-dependent DNA helicase PcrA
MTQIRLSEKQREIVESKDGALLVLASAGSGKTRVLTERVRHLLVSKTGTHKVLALTFTNKAAEEMQFRLGGVSEIRERSFIGTIHKFCLEIIRSKGSAINIPETLHIFEREQDRMEILLETFNNNPLLMNHLNKFETDKDKKSLLYDVLSYISQKKKNLFGMAGIKGDPHDDELDSLAYDEYNAILSSQNAIDFDDVICIAYRILVERPKIAELYRKMYKYVCIDEAQDLNFAQYEFIRALCGEEGRNVLMVGDPNQAIYGFNGSNKAYMTDKFVKDFSAKTIRLSENYRSASLVLHAANRLIPKAVDASNAAIKGEFQIFECDNELKEANLIAEKIAESILRKNHPDIEDEITPESFAVLARTKYVFANLEKALKVKNIPFYHKKTNDLSDFESDLIRLYDLGMRILVNPIDKLHFQQICRLLNIGDAGNSNSTSGIDKLASLLDSIIDTDQRDDYKALIECWKRVNTNINAFPKALDSLEKYVNDSSYYTKDNAINRSYIIQDILELRDLWTQYSLQANTESKTLSGFRNQIALGIAPSKSKKNAGVTLGTIHSVKGLEFDIVFVMGMTDNTFPDYRAVRQGQSALNEERNNAFVALTRSRRLLYLTYPREKFMPWDKEKPVRQFPSRFIKEIERG